MGKYLKKFAVYLDQNYLSEMAKVDDNTKVRPQFKRIFDLLHQGFTEEKLIVPRSMFHDIETSLASALTEKIQSYQGYLGQTKLQHRTWVQAYEIDAAARAYLGEAHIASDYKIIFERDPDIRAQRFDIRINLGDGLIDWRSSRSDTIESMTKLRTQIQDEGVTAREQERRELDVQTRFLATEHATQLRSLFHGSAPDTEIFIKSSYFSSIPSIVIYSKMWAKLLTGFSKRSFKTGDETDVEIISTYLPYVDILTTDVFMASLIRDLGLDKKYGTEVYGASTVELDRLEERLKSLVPSLEVVNRPIATIFVKSDNAIKKNSLEFFQKLGDQVRTAEGRNIGWVEVFGFNDGAMPQYHDPRIHNAFPFYGLQEVHEVPTDPKVILEEILETCRKECRTEKFIIIDKYRDLPDDFVITLIKYCEENKGQILSFPIYQKAGTHN